MNIIQVTEWENSAVLDCFPEFTITTRFEHKPERLKFSSATMESILKHLRIQKYSDTIALTGIVAINSDNVVDTTSSDYITNPLPYVEKVSVRYIIDENNTKVGLGIIRIKENVLIWRIPVMWIDNQDSINFPHAFIMNKRYTHVIESMYTI